MSPAASPSARAYYGLTYDSARRRTVLFSGSGGASDTWEWDGTTWTQESLATSPAGRCCHALAYDCLRSSTVLFGGAPGRVVSSDTWEYDGTNWVQKTPNGGVTSPPARVSASLSYDSARSRSVLFSGYTSSSYTGAAVSTRPT